MVATRVTPPPVKEAAAPDGLTEDEVRARRAYGEGNTVSLPMSRSYRQILRANFFTMMNAILLTLGLLLIAFGQVADAMLTAGIVFINGLIAIWQEVRAKRQLDRIALLNRPKTVAIRAGRESMIDPVEIVRGDILIARRGDQVVVDGQIVAGQMEVDESLLTGESDPITASIGDPVYSGSFCLSGSARYVATQVGMASLASKLTAGARAFRQIRTPLQREIEILVRVVMLVVAFLALLLALIANVTRLPVVQELQMASVIAGLVPNGLIFTVTTAYAIGAVRMAGKGTLIQRTNAVESLANVDVLCLDKTGTLTANRLVVHAVHAVEGSEEVFTRLLADYVTSTAAHDPTSEAIIAAYGGRAEPIRETVPFSSARKWSAARFDSGSYVLGAPEMLLPHAAAPGAPMERWLAEGLRVLLFARLPDGASLHDEEGKPLLDAAVRPVGFVSLRDELRPEAAATLRGFREAGIHVKIISGDHPTTVAALARQAGLGANLRGMSGVELAAMDDAQVAQIVEETTIFGRITPQQKERLVGALQARGHYLAMIGDGVNDVLSLKKADLGIAMQSGSAAARGVADMVLLNDSFAALPVAFREGQRIRNGMRDCLALYLTRLIYAPPLILAVGAVTGTFPFTPKNTALIAFLTVGVPPLALVAWAQPGAQARRGMIRSLYAFVVPAALLLLLLALGVYVAVFVRHVPAGVEMSDDRALDAATRVARSALTTVMILGGLVMIPFLRSPTQEGSDDGAPSGKWRRALLALTMLIGYIIMLSIPRMRAFFDVAPLHRAEYAAIGGAVAGWALLLWWVWRSRALERFVGIDLR